MKVSFVIPTYNRAEKVKRTIQSVLNQKSATVEAIVVDDASTDSIRETMELFRDHPEVRYIRFEKNRGQNVARNVGIEAATGDLVAILDSDNEDFGSDLSPVWETLQQNKDLLAVFTGAVSCATRKRMGNFSSAGKVFGWEGFLNGVYQGEYQPFFKKSDITGKVFDEGLGIKRSCTTLAWLRLGKKHKFTILDIPTLLYDDTGEDRMGNISNVLHDAEEMYQCNSLILENFGNDILAYPKAYSTLQLNMAYYSLLFQGRWKAWKHLKDVSWLRSDKVRWLIVASCILAGPGLVKWARKLLA